MFENIVFSEMPAMRPIGPKRQVVLLEPLRVQWQSGNLEIPAGFIHDGPSIPDRLRGIVFYTHRLLRPSIVHDYLYAKGMWTRKRCDRFFLEALKTEGAGLVRRHAMWAAVRAGGIGRWG